MSKYTTELRYPIQQKLKTMKLTDDEINWPEIYPLLGLSDYPIFDEKYRQTLNDKIIRAYWFREIGFETIGLFRFHMRRLMHEIMPYYNQLYRSEGLITSPLKSRDLSETETWARDEDITVKGRTTDEYTDNVKGTSDSDTVTTNHTETDEHVETTDRNVFQDTPMNGLDTGAVKSMDYATNVTFDDGTTDSDSTTDSNGKVTVDTSTSSNTTHEGIGSSNRTETGDYEGTRERHESGFTESESELLLKWRKTFINIDMEILHEVSVLFMHLW